MNLSESWMLGRLGALKLSFILCIALTLPMPMPEAILQSKPNTRQRMSVLAKDIDPM